MFLSKLYNLCFVVYRAWWSGRSTSFKGLGTVVSWILGGFVYVRNFAHASLKFANLALDP